MRRGASVATATKKQPVMADIHDLEGGGVLDGKKSYSRSSSNDSFPLSGASAPSDAFLPTAPMAVDMGTEINPSGKDKKRRVKHSYAYLTRQSPNSLRNYAILLFVITGLVCPFLPIEWSILFLVMASCCFGAIASLWLSRSVLQCDDGTPEMRAVSDPIREGAEGFLKVQYSAIAKFAVPLAGLIVFSYQFRPHGAIGDASHDPTLQEQQQQEEGVAAQLEGVAILGNTVLGIVAAVGFVCGAVCSAVSGYTSMWVAAQSNIRVASAGRRTYGEALVVCFRGGAFSAVLNLTLCIAGVSTLYTALYLLFANGGGGQNTLKSTDIPMLLVVCSTTFLCEQVFVADNTYLVHFAHITGVRFRGFFCSFIHAVGRWYIY